MPTLTFLLNILSCTSPKLGKRYLKQRCTGENEVDCFPKHNASNIGHIWTGVEESSTKGKFTVNMAQFVASVRLNGYDCRQRIKIAQYHGLTLSCTHSELSSMVLLLLQMPYILCPRTFSQPNRFCFLCIMGIALARKIHIIAVVVSLRFIASQT